MKYKDLTAFDNHLKKSFPDHVSYAFGAIIPNFEERSHFFHSLLSKLNHFFPGANVWRYDKERGDIGKVANELGSNSLFAETSIYIFETLDEADQALIDLLKSHIRSAHASCFFLLGASKKEKIDRLYTDLKKELIILDLSEEKPWNRKERLIGEINLYAKKRGKILEPLLIERLMTVCQMNLGMLLKTLEQCIIFAAGQDTIALHHVEPILPSDPEEKMWDLSEKCIFGKEPIYPGDDLDWFLFLGSVRYQLQTGLKILGVKEVLPHDFPKIHKNRLTQLVKRAHELGPLYFQQGIVYLFELELRTRTSLDPKKGFDLLLFYFQKEKQRATPLAELAR